LSFSIVAGLLGGLGLFIYGMKQMSEGLQKTAGKKLRRILAVLTNKPIMGVAVGTVVTSIVQSSSATTVMVVGFVNAGLMTLAQSIGVIMGANIGTTITAQLVAFELGDYAFHAIAIGAFTYLFSRSKKFQYIGQVLLGFGILFLGLNTMSDAMRPLRGSQVFVDLMKNFSVYPILGVLAGMGVTMIIQSSSATFGILLGLVSVGVIDYSSGVPILLGSNIGTTITAILSAIGANLTARRAAAAHFVFNVIGAGLLISFLYIIPDFTLHLHKLLINIGGFFGQGNVSEERLLANTHTLFNVANTLIWLPFTGFMVSLVKRILPGEEEYVQPGLTHIDDRMIETPSVALEQVKKEIIAMHGIARDMVCEVVNGFMDRNSGVVEKIRRHESIVNEMEEELLHFLQRIPQGQLTEIDIRSMDKYFAVIDDIESIADDATEIANLIEYELDNKLKFSQEAQNTIKEVSQIVCDVLEKSVELVKTDNLSLVKEILEVEAELDEMQIRFRDESIGRIKSSTKDVIDPNAGIILLELLDNLEHITDQMADIAHSIREIYVEGKKIG